MKMQQKKATLTNSRVLFNDESISGLHTDTTLRCRTCLTSQLTVNCLLACQSATSTTVQTHNQQNIISNNCISHSCHVQTNSLNSENQQFRNKTISKQTNDNTNHIF